MKIALVVGHNERRQGAFAPIPINETEFRFWDGLLKDCNVDPFRVFRRDPDCAYYEQIRKVYGEIDAWGADWSVEFHFNAGGGSGTETLSSGTRGSRFLCDRLQVAMVDLLALPDRGVKVRSKGQRGGASLWAGKAPAALVEPFFADCYGDIRRVASVGPEVLRDTILDALK